MALMFPASWMTWFFSKSYTENFHLEREYAHKAALAKSVEGFRREADQYKEIMTYGVFAELLTNPSMHNSPEPARSPVQSVLNDLRNMITKNKIDGGV
jgi:hypothetical protein